MPQRRSLIVPIDSLGREDASLVGGKCANLGELMRTGIPVPPGFVVTAAAYDWFLDSAGIRSSAKLLLDDLDVGDGAGLERAASEVRCLIADAEMPDEAASEIVERYRRMGLGAVAVRSSGTAEDLTEASFAGQQETYLNVEGEADVVRAVQKCWASLFEPRAVYYRAANGFSQLDVSMAVVVQRMVQSDRSGVMFTLNPVTNDESQILIEAVYGLGEGAVSGILTPDMYVVDKGCGMILDRQVTPQEQELVRCADVASCEELNHWASIEWGRRRKQKLSDEEIAELAALGQRLEQHFGRPQDVEWACEGRNVYIVQSRPITTTRR
ncbi:MAG TPA: PEP/pyruvate-binding domain-containing protein [Dehalococcoidia bacterium]|nr:PEP/pyruvate-binding domain-containing protein [Dehalococcoidia bacterium]